MNAEKLAQVERVFVQSACLLGIGRAENILTLLSYGFGNTKAIASEIPSETPFKLTAKEKRDLDQDLEVAYQKGDKHTPILDKVTKPKGMSNHIRTWIQENPGNTIRCCVKALAKTHANEYPNEETAKKKIAAIVYALKANKRIKSDDNGNLTIMAN